VLPPGGLHEVTLQGLQGLEVGVVEEITEHDEVRIERYGLVAVEERLVARRVARNGEVEHLEDAPGAGRLGGQPGGELHGPGLVLVHAIAERDGVAKQKDPVCTSLLVDDYIAGKHRAWAVVGTFGDNFDNAAHRAAEPLGLCAKDIEALRELGICLNYNGYGPKVEDLHFPPDELFRRLHPYTDPLEFIVADDTFAALREGFAEDMAKARAVSPQLATERHGIYVLPAEAWARRASGVLANELAQGAPERAHALLTRLPQGGFVVSVRAPLTAPDGADALCRQFPSGGGRKAAAGINELPEADYDAFVERFRAAF